LQIRLSSVSLSQTLLYLRIGGMEKNDSLKTANDPLVSCIVSAKHPDVYRKPKN
jgi:hypothetical protein